VLFVPVMSSPKQTTRWSLRCSSLVSSLRAAKAIFTGNRTQNKFLGLWPLFLWFPGRNKQLWSWCNSCLVLELHKLASLGQKHTSYVRGFCYKITPTRTLVRSSDLTKIPSWFHGISMPIWSKLVYRFWSYKQTYMLHTCICTQTHNFSSMYKI
jgi:hypothetical protein